MLIADAAAQERAKYQEMWSVEAYRTADSPGEFHVPSFLHVVNPYPHTSIIDIGCGAGRAGLDFAAKGFKVRWLDLTDAALDPRVDRDRFIESPIWSKQWADEYSFDYGYCSDVLEHIPPEYTMLSIERILTACETSWFLVANRPDQFGAHIGKTLHLTVQPYGWWLERIGSLGNVTDARDLCGASLFVVTR
jgi:SAM-dependent methyltransferase